MSELLKNIDARTRLAGTNTLEILMFGLGRDNRTGREETFGIGVFNVREVMHAPAITRAPEMPHSVEGTVSLRGVPAPVIDLARRLGIETDCRPETMIVAEYNGQMHGLLVREVGSILFLERSALRVPSARQRDEIGGSVSAITELSDGRVVMVLDVEKVLAVAARFNIEGMEIGNAQPPGTERAELADDDPLPAREHIPRSLDAMRDEMGVGQDRLVGGQHGLPARIDARAKLAASNEMEVLLFNLGSDEKFGISVFRVKEVCPTGKITRTPNMPAGVDGIVLLHGKVLPVLNLADLMGIDPQEKHRTMMVTEMNGRMLGLLVRGVDRIIRVDSDKVSGAEGRVCENGALITSIAEMEEGMRISILDVEQILLNAFGEALVGKVEGARLERSEHILHR